MFINHRTIEAKSKTKKKRKKDDFTPGGINNRRPDRALIVYTNLIKRFFNTRPIILGGIEASLRRVAHYDYWSNRIRKSILFDAKADLLVYGMGEKAVIETARRLREGKGITDIPGTCYISRDKKPDYIELHSYQEAKKDKQAFIDMFSTFYHNNNPITAKGLCQKQDTRYLVQNPPSPYLSRKDLDRVYGMDFERDLHPFYKQEGKVRALETIKFSLTTHRGCYGECNFCAIAVHQGTTVRWRSEKSILREAELLTQYPDFKGYILDVGGPTANMYSIECRKKLSKGNCPDKRCLYPRVCSHLETDHGDQIKLLKKLRRLKGIKKVFVASGLRYDLLLNDKRHGLQYLENLVQHHVSGQLKAAPEHTEEMALIRMGKPSPDSLLKFKKLFYRLTEKAKKKQFLTYYLMAAHPGCTRDHMVRLKKFAQRELEINPEQVQIFTPTPSTYSTLMYYTETDPFTGDKIFVEKNNTGKEEQKRILLGGKVAVVARKTSRYSA